MAGRPQVLQRSLDRGRAEQRSRRPRRPLDQPGDDGGGVFPERGNRNARRKQPRQRFIPLHDDEQIDEEAGIVPHPDPIRNTPLHIPENRKV